MKHKLAVITSHVIQYQTPLFKKLSAHPDIDLTVYFCWDFGAKKTYDKQFGVSVEWDIPLLDGYCYRFLKNFSPKPSSEFLGEINPGIIKELLKNKYDAVLVYGWNSPTSWFAYLTSFILKIPILIHSENPFNQEAVKNKLKVLIKKIILGFIFRRAKTLLYIGKENKIFYERYGAPEKKLVFFPYAVDNERFMDQHQKIKNASEINSTRKKLGISEKDMVILFVGKLTPKKHPLDLLMSFEKIKLENKSLIFVGDGILRPDLEKYAKDRGLKNIHFAGFQNQTVLPHFYAAADVFVLPSGAGETWGLVVNEAMCFGLPVVVSKTCGSAADLVRTGQNGFAFKEGDMSELTSRLEELIQSPEKRAAFGKKSLEIIKEYSHEKDISAIIRALEIEKSSRQ